MTTSFVPNSYSEPEEVAPAKPLSKFDIALGVFLGLWGYSITAGIVYAIIRTATT